MPILGIIDSFRIYLSPNLFSSRKLNQKKNQTEPKVQKENIPKTMGKLIRVEMFYFLVASNGKLTEVRKNKRLQRSIKWIDLRQSTLLRRYIRIYTYLRTHTYTSTQKPNTHMHTHKYIYKRMYLIVKMSFYTDFSEKLQSYKNRYSRRFSFDTTSIEKSNIIDS